MKTGSKEKRISYSCSQTFQSQTCGEAGPGWTSWTSPPAL